MKMEYFNALKFRDMYNFYHDYDLIRRNLILVENDKSQFLSWFARVASCK